MARVRRRGDAPGRRGHQARPRPRRLRRGGGRAACGVRRPGAARLPARGRPARRADLRLLGLRGVRRATWPADRGRHRGVRGRDADGALPRWGGRRRRAAGPGPRAGGRARHVPPCPTRGLRHRSRRARAAGPRRGGVPLTARAPAPGGVHADRGSRAVARLRPGRPARRRGGEDHQRPVRRPGEPRQGVLRHAAAGRDRARLGAPALVRGRRAPGRWPGGSRGPRRGRAHRVAVGAARQEPAARRRGRRRRPLRDRAAQPGRDG